MPSCLKARRGRPSFAEMRAELDKLRKPKAKDMEALYENYRAQCMAANPRLKEIVVREDWVNWKAVVMSLPREQIKEVLGCGIRKLWLKETECVYEGVYRFHVEHLDGSFASFEWREVYNDPYHGYHDKSYKDDVETALRAAVLHHLVDYKEMLSKESQMELHSNISGIALPWEKAVVQHFPTTFHDLVDAFLNEVNLKAEQVFLEWDDGHVYRVKDQGLLERWQSYHLMKANFRVIATEEAMEQDHL